MSVSGRRTGRRWGRWAAAAAVAALAPAADAVVPDLTWDASATHPTAPVDGSGIWNAAGIAVWSNGTADVPWTDGANATIGFNTGSAPYTIALAANVSAGSVEFDPPGTGASYTVNAGGYTLSIPTGNLTVLGSTVTLVNGTFSTGDATGTNAGGVVVESGGVLTVGPGAVLATSALNGDFTNATVYFNGGTFRALANPSTTAPANGQLYDAIAATTAAYISGGGLTFDTMPVAAGIAYVTDPFAHDPAVAGPDGGLTVTGGGLLQLGYAGEVPAFNPVYTYTGTTAVVGNTTLRLDTAGGTAAVTGSPGTGPFPDTRFTVAAGSTLAVAVTDGIVGQTGTTPVTVNGGTLSLVGGHSAHLADVTLNGGTITADAAGGTFTLLAGAELHATAAATVSPGAVAFDVGSDVRTDAGVTLTVSCPVVDGTAAGDTAGGLTTVGPGTVLLTAANPYTGPTNVSAGLLRLAAGATLADTSAVSVAAGATLAATGTLNPAAPLTLAGTVTLTPPAGTGIAVRSLGPTTVNAGGLLALAPSTAAANRSLLVLPSLVLNGGRADVGNGDAVVHNGSLAALTAAAATGFAGGAWTGPGLDSTAAAADPQHLTAVGVVPNASPSGTALYSTFDGQAVTASDVLIRYTYYGDANLDGKVDAADYLRVDAGYFNHLTGWANGDFNYDGVVDGSDYTLMDNAFDQQAGGIGTPAASLANASASPGSVAVPAAAVVPATVPEPATTVAITVLIATGLTGRPRRRFRAVARHQT